MVAEGDLKKEQIFKHALTYAFYNVLMNYAN